MRWKTLEFLGKLNTAQKETFAFVSRNCPSSVDEISGFEDALTLSIKNTEFRNVKNKFQSMLNEYIKRINSTDRVLIPAEKSRNIYQIDKSDYNKFLRQNVTKRYKGSTANQVKNINRQSKKIAEKLNIDDRVAKLQETEAYITVKDDKDGFPNHPSS